MLWRAGKGRGGDSPILSNSNQPLVLEMFAVKCQDQAITAVAKVTC